MDSDAQVAAALDLKDSQPKPKSKKDIELEDFKAALEQSLRTTYNLEMNVSLELNFAEITFHQ